MYDDIIYIVFVQMLDDHFATLIPWLFVLDSS